MALYKLDKRQLENLATFLLAVRIKGSDSFKLIEISKLLKACAETGLLELKDDQVRLLRSWLDDMPIEGRIAFIMAEVQLALAKKHEEKQEKQEEKKPE
jgi:hypothetical protein